MAHPPSASNNRRPDDHLQLTLGLSINTTTEQPPATAALPQDRPAIPRRRQNPRQTASRSVRRRPDNADGETIPPPYPWATDRPCRLHSLEHLMSNGHVWVKGNVTCRKCERSYEMAFDLEKKFCETGGYFLKMKDEMRHRATEEWTKPALPECRLCGEKNAVMPEIAGEERINWLFLFLGQLIGCCKFRDLKYFLDKNDVHRTAAKNRLVYLVYVCICKQLDPNGPFDV